jgi:hypothetical protein
MSLEETCQA